MEVVEEESQAGPGKREMAERHAWIPKEEEHAGHAGHRYEGQPRGKAIESVYQVERVHRANDPEHRKHGKQPLRTPGENAMESDARPVDGSAGDCQLAEQLDHRPEAELVVSESHADENRRQRDQAENGVVRHSVHRMAGEEERAEDRPRHGKEYR